MREANVSVDRPFREMSNQHQQALEFARAGDWDAAHRIVQKKSDAFSSLIHAYLHRVEGDLGNAAYWYRRAGEPERRDSLEAELRDLFARLEKSRVT